MGSLQDDLDRIAAMQGKSIPSGRVITGESGGPASFDAALPGDRYKAPVPHDPIDDDEEADERPELVESPLIPRRQPEPEPMAPEFLENFRAPDLSILGNDAAAYIAAYQGRQVELTKQEAAAVRKVVLEAIKRGITAQLAEVKALLPKRKRKRAGQKPVKDLLTEACFPGGIIPPPEGMPGITKKRGRPRKVTP